jgi:hypothetical protein
MKKIIILLTAVFMFAGLFGQGRISETNKDLLRIIEALEKNGVEHYDLQIVPEDNVDFFVSDATTPDDFINNLENVVASKSSTLNSYSLYLMWQYEWGIGYFWTGLFTSGTTSITGSDWDGVYHYVKYIYSPETHLFQAFTPNPYVERIADCNYCGSNYYQACGALYENNRVYIPGIGYVVIKVPYGTHRCVTFPNV